MTELPNPHDRFFKELFAHLPTARDFVRHYLPEPLSAALDLRTLTIVKESFIDEQLRNYFSDLLFHARRKQGGDVLIYLLLEHKSLPDALVALQLFLYLARIWQPNFQDKQKPLPLVFPVVFYHGTEKWSVSQQFSGLFDFAGVEAMREFVPEFKYHLCDLSKIEVDKGEPRLRAGLATLKYVFRRELATRVGEIFQAIKLLPPRRGFLYLKTVLTYLLQAAQRLQPETIQLGLQETFPEHEEVLMQTIAERWMKQATQQGLQQGLQQGAQRQAAATALRQLQRRFGSFDTRLQKRIRLLSTSTLEALSEALLDFTAKKDLLEWLAAHDPK